MEKGSRLFHDLDKWVGIPVVFILGLFKKRKRSLDVSNIKRIAVLNLASIGDTVLMSASINDLKSKYPDAELIAFTGGSNYQIFQLIPGVSKVVKLNLLNFFYSIRQIKAQGYFDVAIEYMPWSRINSIYTFFINAGFRIGFKGENQFRHYVFDEAVEHSPDMHELDNYRNLTKLIYDGPPQNQALMVRPSSKSIKRIAEFGNYCIIHAWPGGYKSYMKEWSNKKWIELITNIESKYDHILISGAPSDMVKSNNLCKLINEAGVDKNVINISGEFNLNEIIHVISNAAMIVSVNTGIAHIAATLNIKQVCLHGPTNPMRWKPISPLTISITPEKGNYGYLNYGFEYERASGNCMEDIVLEKVVEAINRLSVTKYAVE